MNGTEFAERLTKCVKELFRDEKSKNYLAMYTDEAIDTVNGAFGLASTKSNRRKDIMNLCVRRISEEFSRLSKYVVEITCAVHDPRLNNGRRARLIPSLHISETGKTTLTLMLEVGSMLYCYGKEVNTAKIADIGKFAQKFIDKHFDEFGFASWETYAIGQKYDDLKNFCKKHGIELSGKLSIKRPGFRKRSIE